MAAPDRVARHHGDNGLGEPADLHLEVEDVQPADAALGYLVVAEVAVVAAYPLIASRAERVRALTRQDDDADVRVVAAHVERVGTARRGSAAGTRCGPPAGRW